MTEEEIKDPAAVLAELRRAQEDLKALRQNLNDLEKERTNLSTELEALKNVEPDAWKNRALQAEIKSALNRKGLKDPDRLMKYVSLDGLDFDDSGALTGFDEQFKALKSDLPEVFDVKVKAGGKGDIFADGAPEKQLSSTEAQVARLFNQ